MLNILDTIDRNGRRVAIIIDKIVSISDGDIDPGDPENDERPPRRRGEPAPTAEQIGTVINTEAISPGIDSHLSRFYLDDSYATASGTVINTESRSYHVNLSYETVLAYMRGDTTEGDTAKRLIEQGGTWS